MLEYLWKNRERPPLFSRAWLKTWAKRVLMLPALVEQELRLSRLKRRGACIGAGTVISPADIQGKINLITIGEQSFIGRVSIQAHAEVRIGSKVCINDEVKLLTASHDVRNESWKVFCKPIVIDDFAWVATGATILPGVHIGRGAVVGAEAVVAKDVPDHGVAVGNPARITEQVRAKQLSYTPTSFLAIHVAWLGKPAGQATIL